MENNIVLPEQVQAKYDDKRFPTIWHAMVGSALMYAPVYAVLFLITAILGTNYGNLFKTEFGSDMFSATLSQFFAVLIVPVLMMLITKRDFKATLRLNKNINILQVLLLGIFSVSIFFLLQIINGMFITMLSGFLGEPSPSNISDATNITQLLFEIVIVGGLPAICEEIFFRGFVLRAFERKSPIIAIIMSALIFAIMHGNLQQLVYAFLCGIILGTVVVLTDSLFAGCMIHFTLNTISVILSYPPINNMYVDFVTNNAYIFSSIVMLVLPVIAAGSLTLFILHTLSRNKDKYGKKVPSELAYASLMPQEKSWEKSVKAVAWIVFILVNVFFMFISWFM